MALTDTTQSGEPRRQATPQKPSAPLVGTATSSGAREKKKKASNAKKAGDRRRAGPEAAGQRALNKAKAGEFASVEIRGILYWSGSRAARRAEDEFFGFCNHVDGDGDEGWLEIEDLDFGLVVAGS